MKPQKLIETGKDFAVGSAITFVAVGLIGALGYAAFRLFHALKDTTPHLGMFVILVALLGGVLALVANFITEMGRDFRE